jgi:hypothetical protein
MMYRRSTFLLPFLVGAALLSLSSAANIAVDWTFPTSGSTSLPGMTANVGDVAIFTFTDGVHNGK